MLIFNVSRYTMVENRQEKSHFKAVNGIYKLSYLNFRAKTIKCNVCHFWRENSNRYFNYYEEVKFVYVTTILPLFLLEYNGCVLSDTGRRLEW